MFLLLSRYRLLWKAKAYSLTEDSNEKNTNTIQLMKYDVIIIGSGLGGLQCGYILAKKGLKVCILEKNAVAGGCLQTFKRNGIRLDTGFHYVGGLDENQSLHTLFQYFHLLDLPWKRLDGHAFDEVIIDDQRFSFANGYECFADTLSQIYPHQRQELRQYAATLQATNESLFDSLKREKREAFYNSSLFATSAWQYLQQTISDPMLRQVLAGTSLKMELNQELPLYVFAQINSSFIQSAWRLCGGGQQIAQQLATQFEAMGGKIMLKAEVTRLIDGNGRIERVEINRGEDYFTTQKVISDVHPHVTLNLMAESALIRPIYRRRIAQLANSFGAFTVHLQFKEGVMPYLNRNVYVYKNTLPWSQNTRKVNKLLIYFQPPNGQHTTNNIDLITPVLWEEVALFADSVLGQRPPAYQEWKEQKIQDCINLAACCIPDLKSRIAYIYASSPLSWRDYTATFCGSAYGICKDANRLAQTVLSTQTTVENLLLTGQNLNLHGILGVSMTSLLTCAQILGADTICEEVLS
jgi:all-trans-retinol 13,14-reductase